VKLSAKLNVEKALKVKDAVGKTINEFAAAVEPKYFKN